jgi:hypothetical protein
MRARTAIAVLAFFLAAPAAAQEAPEAVYDKFHRAARAANIAEMAKVSTEARAREITAGNKFELAILAETFPESYTLTRKTLSKDGNRMQLRATGMHSFMGGKKQPMYGIIDLVKLKGEWKVDTVGWAQDKWAEEKIK